MTPQQPLRILFAGTPEFAAQHLQALLDSPYQVIGVYTQPDRPAGRGQKLTPSPVKKLALEHQLPVYQPVSLRQAEAQQQLASLDADLMIVVAYGLILPQVVLDTPRLGCINVHASLLPRWRGAAPIHRALLAGDQQTGVTIMQMEAGLDTGPMLYTLETPILPRDTSGSLHDRLATLGAKALIACLDRLQQGPVVGEPQDDSLATYAHKLDKSEGDLDWSQSASALDTLVRGLQPGPMAYTYLGDQRIRLWQAEPAVNPNSGAAPGTLIRADKRGLLVACGEDALLITQLQWPGSKAMSAADLLNSRADQLQPGIRFHPAPADEDSAS
ncbi:methionyl-tRNA formyltransferase [Balneatrix alpica]|uniref:Methionyl-tRNA formyltransferase n=1 Tax=Balneatrix alpica TaxID=75684 RepID=A0ABV5ZC92_9GAMM|nr:methionyl-tRNA formyltransferase [Balneatrix alpica]